MKEPLMDIFILDVGGGRISPRGSCGKPTLPGRPLLDFFKKSLRDIENVIESIKRLLFLMINMKKSNRHGIAIICR